MPREVCGLHASIPNGVTAPGYVLPRLVVPMNGFTYDTGSLTSGSGAATAGVAVTTRPVAAMTAMARTLNTLPP